MSRTYRIRRSDAVYLIIFSVVWFGIVVGAAVKDAPDHVSAWAVLAAFLTIAFALLPAFAVARLPYEITVNDDGTCVLRGRIGTRTLRAQRIKSLSYDEGDVELRHDRGKISFRVTYDFPQFLRHLRTLNPAIELDGTLSAALEDESE